MNGSDGTRGTAAPWALIACAVALLATAAPAAAASVTYSVTAWDASPGHLSLPQFDPALGRLTSVTVTLAQSLSANLQFENPTRDSLDVTTTWTTMWSVNGPFGQALSTSRSRSAADTLARYDHVRDYEGASGRTYYWSEAPVVRNLYTDAAQLALATGLGWLLFPTDGFADARVTFSRGSLWHVFDLVSDLTLSITYAYEPAPSLPAPESASLVLVGGGLVAAILWRRRRRRVQ